MKVSWELEVLPDIDSVNPAGRHHPADEPQSAASKAKTGSCWRSPRDGIISADEKPSLYDGDHGRALRPGGVRFTSYDTLKEESA